MLRAAFKIVFAFMVLLSKVTVSTAFSGIDSPRVASLSITNYINTAILTSVPIGSGLQMDFVRSVEWNKHWQEELLNFDKMLQTEGGGINAGEPCLFGDILSFLKDTTIQKLDRFEALGQRLEMKACILGAPTKRSAFCIRHNRICAAANLHDLNTDYVLVLHVNLWFAVVFVLDRFMLHLLEL